VTFAKPELLATVGPSLPVLTYCDPTLSVYGALGFGRTTLRRATLSLRAWRAFLRLALHGKFPSSPKGQDALQLGGDIVVDADCRLVWRRAQDGPEDYPSFEDLVNAVNLASAPRDIRPR
jgi:hypothetical protein